MVHELRNFPRQHASYPCSLHEHIIINIPIISRLIFHTNRPPLEKNIIFVRYHKPKSLETELPFGHDYIYVISLREVKTL